MIIAHITDFHVGRIIQTSVSPIDLYDKMLNAVAHLRGLEPQPDIIMLTGDLSNHGGEADYIRVRQALQTLNVPVYIIPGNHDRRDTLRYIFPDHDYWIDDNFLHFTIENHPLRIIGLDTLLNGSHEGVMDRQRLDWFEARLQEDDRATVVFMHHPPFKTGLYYPDTLMCRNGESFGDIVERYSQIQAIICGHVHRDVVTFWRGAPAYVTGSATFANGLILHPVDDVDPLFEPPICRLFVWENNRLTSYLSFIDDYPYGLSEGVPAPPQNE